MHDLVIARYNEPLEWVQLLPASFRVHIYNKGTPITAAAVGARAQVTDCPNVGRESETYLSHMILHGPGDGRFTVFAQGDPFEHSPDFLELLATAAGWHDVQPLPWCWKEHANIPPAALRRATARLRAELPGGQVGGQAGGLRVRPELFSLATWNPIEFIDFGAARTGHAYRTLWGLPEGTNLASHFFTACLLPELAARAARHLVGQFSYGAIFAVHNRLIAELLVRALRRMRQGALGPACFGYVIERLWLHLFGTPFVLPAPCTEPAALAAE